MKLDRKLGFVAAVVVVVLVVVFGLLTRTGNEEPNELKGPRGPKGQEGQEGPKGPKEVKGPEGRRLPYAPVRVEAVITVAECERLIARATGSLQRSMTLGNVVSDVRTSEQAWVDTTDASVGDIVTKIRTRTAQMTGIFREDLFEQLQVARYEASQQYKPHFDACIEQCDRDKRERIPRRATLLVYLTDDFEEGSTHFPSIDARVRPVRGDGVLFYNSDADTGGEIPDSIHAGEPVRSGTKWIANCWVRYDPTSRYL
jgi:prolyl 4-hydroxylase